MACLLLRRWIDHERSQIRPTQRGEYFERMSHGNVLEYRAQSTTLEGVTAAFNVELGLGHDGKLERVPGDVVSANFFEVLGVRMTTGRGFRPEEDQSPGGNPVVVISHALWKRTFGGDPGIVGTAVTINGHGFTVIGVAAKGFIGIDIMSATQAWVPLSMLAAARPIIGDPNRMLTSHEISWVRAFGRLKPGVPLSSAQAEMTAIAALLEQAYPESNTDRGILISSGLVGAGGSRKNTQIGRFLTLLHCVVSLVLFVACANVANMSLARGFTRTREMGIRLSLGAGRFQLTRQLFVENLLIALASGCAGVLLSYWFSDLIILMIPQDGKSEALNLSPDLRVVAFAAGASLIAAIGSGLLPAWRTGRRGTVNALKESSVQSGHHRSLLRDGFVAAQVALSLMLLVGAGLFIRTAKHAVNIATGYDVNGILIGSVDVGLAGYNEETGRRFFDDLVERARTLPGTSATAMVAMAPLTGGGFMGPGHFSRRQKGCLGIGAGDAGEHRSGTTLGEPASRRDGDRPGHVWHRVSPPERGRTAGMLHSGTASGQGRSHGSFETRLRMHDW
ncbi:MAG: ABC transporter permease [Verrucomicrobia bacterium]|nr:ABC transporter permease [Verrucomicrobiota bacterium]